MNRATRDKIAAGTDQATLAGGNACWQTAPKVFEKLNEDFGPFDVDLFADATNHLCPVWFGPDSPVQCYDALETYWTGYGKNGYGNPPYGRFIQKALAKAKDMAAKHFASTLLLPLRLTKGFKEHVLDGASDILFCSRRLVFFEDGLPRVSFQEGKPRADGALFDSVIVRYRPGHVDQPTVGLWEVPKHVTKEQIEEAAEQLRGKAA